ncbi:PepSY domain-containing protein [Rhodopseudomonas boonkerdii]|uniref:PepSY domain-containing protein n=1 Tax=Rhodopseudomonas boonkerdii TaxID=475937 RepID=UPI001E3A013B|nr:PepSY domain-containing protein [Rhodopseudomonas boonkerdii]UGV27297.1 PepSY domain-containing protein [Rhodopseudomonas boonkerdii]
MKYAAVALIAASLGLAVDIAHADDVACKSAAAGQGFSIERAIEKAEALGYSVKKAKRSKGCWEIEGFDRNGAEVEVRVDPGSGEIVKSSKWRNDRFSN